MTVRSSQGEREPVSKPPFLTMVAGFVQPGAEGLMVVVAVWVEVTVAV